MTLQDRITATEAESGPLIRSLDLAYHLLADQEGTSGPAGNMAAEALEMIHAAIVAACPSAAVYAALCAGNIQALEAALHYRDAAVTPTP